ncbi:MAG: cofactor-independent phosphoglycerate mutase [Planctomycetota bacterium]
MPDLMKYVLLLPDGAADAPLDALDGKTPIEAAETPTFDRLATDGRQGTVATTPPGMPCGSDICTMSLLGYDPARYHTGRAPLEAAALGLDLDDLTTVFRANWVTVADGKMIDHSAGAISSQESAALLDAVRREIAPPGMALHLGVSYRNILQDIAHLTPGQPPRDYAELDTTAPHDILGQPIKKHRPVGSPHADLLNRLIDDAAALLADHEINAARRELGEPEATHLWPWGQGRRPSLPAFADKYGLRGGMITAVDLLAGIARLIGFARIDAPGQTSYHDTDYAAAGRSAIAALDDFDFVVVHVESPDEAAHAGDPKTKVAAIEAIDQHVAAPLLAALEQRDEPFRVMAMPDHYTRCDTRMHDPTPPPFLIYGHRVRGVLHRPFTEANANESDLRVDHGHELMEYFLRAGLA